MDTKYIFRTTATMIDNAGKEHTISVTHTAYGWEDIADVDAKGLNACYSEIMFQHQDKEFEALEWNTSKL